MTRLCWLLTVALVAPAAAQQDEATILLREWRAAAPPRVMSPPHSEKPVEFEPGIYHLAESMTPPTLCAWPGPDALSSAEANIAGVDVNSYIPLVVEANGTARIPLGSIEPDQGFGVAQRTLELVDRYRFLPAQYHGRSVAVVIPMFFTSRSTRTGAPKGRLTYELPDAAARPILEAGDPVPLIGDPEIGFARIKIQIAETGRVTQVDAMVLRNLNGVPNALPQTDPYVRAFDSILTWRFRPASLNGAAIQVIGHLELDYRSRPGPAAPAPSQPPACAALQ